MKTVNLLAILLSSLALWGQSGQPHWAHNAVWYQIFPERFDNGDPSNDPDVNRIEQTPAGWKISPWTSDWYARDEWETAFQTEFNWSVTKRRYGGDLQGIINRLDYLKDLGVTVLYLNPIFDAPSMHKYDSGSLHHVDRNFGPDPAGDAKIIAQENMLDFGAWRFSEADKLFLKLIQEAHRRNIRIVIDGVFNHTGREFWAFQDLYKRQKDSPYKNWYNVIRFDDPATAENEFDYKGWWNYKALPEFQKEKGSLAKPVVDYIFAITARWMDPNNDGDPSDGVDGWRLDVASEVGLGFWKQWTAHVKHINPEAVTIAEIWDEKAKPYTLYGGFDGVMNYRWLRLVDDFFVTGVKTSDQFVNAQKELLADLKAPVNFSNMNMLESHDTERFSSRFVNPDRPFKEKAKASEGFNVRKPSVLEIERMKRAVFFQFTYVGAPALYYGAESGMWGADDPDDRKPMVWPEKTYDAEKAHPALLFRQPDSVFYDRPLSDWYKQMIALRNSEEVLRHGNIYFISPSPAEKCIAFIRTDDLFRLLLVVINHDDRSSVTVELPRTVRITTGNSLLGNASLHRRRNHVILPPGSFDLVLLERRP